MKKLACTAVGGPEGCDHVFESENLEEFLGQATAHAGEKHADMVANISDEDKAAWKTDAEAKFSAAPDA